MGSPVPEGFELRHFLLRTFRYAFKNSPEALDQVKPIAEGKRQSDMVLDLNSLAVLGEQHREKLEAISHQRNPQLRPDYKRHVKRQKQTNQPTESNPPNPETQE